MFFVKMIFPQGDVATKLAHQSLLNTKIGLTSMVMSCTNQEFVIQQLDDSTYSIHPKPCNCKSCSLTPGPW